VSLRNRARKGLLQPIVVTVLQLQTFLFLVSMSDAGITNTCRVKQLKTFPPLISAGITLSIAGPPMRFFWFPIDFFFLFVFNLSVATPGFVFKDRPRVLSGDLWCWIEFDLLNGMGIVLPHAWTFLREKIRHPLGRPNKIPYSVKRGTHAVASKGKLPIIVYLLCSQLTPILNDKPVGETRGPYETSLSTHTLR